MLGALRAELRAGFESHLEAGAGQTQSAQLGGHLPGQTGARGPAGLAQRGGGHLQLAPARRHLGFGGGERGRQVLGARQSELQPIPFGDGCLERAAEPLFDGL